jgi:spermidine/putrescine transport system permease protein
MKHEIRNFFKKEQSFFWATPALMWQVLFLYVPILVIVGISLSPKVDLYCWHYLTWDHYKAIINPLYGGIIGRSLILAFSNAGICMLIAYPVAYFLALRAHAWKNILLLLLILPFWTNFLVQVYAWFFILERHGFLNRALLKLHLISEPLHIMHTPGAIHLVMLFCYLPFMIMPIYTSLEKINRSLLEASHDLGANDWQSFIHITLPLSLSGLKTGFFLVFIPSFGEFVIPALLGGGKTWYVGSLISYFFIENKQEHLGAAFTVLSALALMSAVLVVSILFNRLRGYSS